MTRKEMLMTIPAPYGQMAVDNCSEEAIKEQNILSIGDALRGGFVWKETDCGYNFWYEVMLGNKPPIKIDNKYKQPLSISEQYVIMTRDKNGLVKWIRVGIDIWLM